MRNGKIQITEACCSHDCGRFNDCARAYINHIGYCALLDYGHMGIAMAHRGKDGLRVTRESYCCGERGDYAMYKPREESGSNKGSNKGGEEGKMLICRKRWVIIKDDSEIFCGLARNYQFKRLDSIGDTAIKTYRSARTARSGFLASWWDAEKLIAAGRIKFVETTESLEMDSGHVYEPATGSEWNIEYVLEHPRGECYNGVAYCPHCDAEVARCSDWDALSVPAGLVKRVPERCPNCGARLKEVKDDK